LLEKDYEEDPEDVLYTMMEDRKKIAEEYSLPLLEEHKDRKECCRTLLDIAARKGIPISYVSRERLNSFNVRGGITVDGKIVVANIDIENSIDVDLYNWSVDFEHELCHALQKMKSPEMSIERQEYEAYILTYLPTAVSTYWDYPEGYIQSNIIVSEMFEHILNSSIFNHKKLGDTAENIQE